MGREQELAELRAALGTPARGHLFLISGEPGIGKTRLADELVAEARQRKARVGWGRCWEGGGVPAYWPWIQVIRSCLTSSDTEQRRAVLDSELAPVVVHEVARIVPELRSSAQPAGASAAQVDPESARFRLFDSVATLLRSFARWQPVLIVIDDLHEADLASLAMLRFVARELHEASIVIVCTYRDAEMHRSAERMKLVEETLREGNLIPLAGLAESEVGLMIEARADHAASEGLAAKIHWLTSGNPLFVDGVVRMLAAEGKLTLASEEDLARLKLPDNVRAAIARRLAMLSGETRNALSIASAIGQEFELSLLASIRELNADSLEDSVGEACEVGIITGAARDRYRFTHPLIREALYTEQKVARIATHRAIGEALELSGVDPTSHLAQLAYHFREAGLVEKAIDYSIRAGEAADALSAFEEAAPHWQTALRLMDQGASGDSNRRAHLLLLLGDEMISGPAKSVEYLEAAIPLQEELGDHEGALRSRSRLVIMLSASILGVMDVRRSQEHFKAAEARCAVLPESSVHGEVYEQWAAACISTRRTHDGISAARRAMEIATRHGDEGTWLGAAISLSFFLIETGSVKEAIELANQARARADRFNDCYYGSSVAWLGSSDHLLLCDPLEAQSWASSELASPRHAQAPSRRAILHWQLVMAWTSAGNLPLARRHLAELGVKKTPELLNLEGHWEEAENDLVALCERSRVIGDRIWESLQLHTLGEFYRVHGDHARAADCLQKGLAIGVEASDVQYELSVRPVLTLLLADSGQFERALTHLDRCRDILEAGEDWRGLAGPVARAEAVLAAHQGLRDLAAERFGHADKIFRRYTLPWRQAENFFYWGRALKTTGDPRANEKFDAAVEIYRRHEAGQRWIDRVESERRASRLSPVESGSPGATSPGVRPERPAIFKREGEYWTLAYRDSAFRLKDVKGLAYIAFLLAHPGERIHVQELIARVDGVADEGLAPHVEIGRDASPAHDLGDAGVALDQQARADYRRQLRELAEDLAEAERLNDSGRAERIRRELEFLKGELSAAVGIGGRNRRAAAHIERARGIVRKNIRATLEKIRREHATLGRHFAASIKTGYYCAYLPDPDRKISWQL